MRKQGMRKWMRGLLFILILCPALCFAEEDILLTPESSLPSLLNYGQRPPAGFSGQDICLQNEAGMSVGLDDFSGEPLLILFFASWCPDCKREAELLSSPEKLAEELGFQMLYVDLVEMERETPESGKEFLKDAGWTASVLYDKERELYHAWGLSEIPTVVMLNSEGEVAAYKSGVLTENVLRGVIEKGMHGGEKAVWNFLERKLLFSPFSLQGESIGIKTIATDNAFAEHNLGIHPGEEDVLSESEGLLMEAALLLDDQMMMDAAAMYVERQMLEQGLPAWYVTRSETRAETDVLIDDLRIIKALTAAAERWPENDYLQQAQKMADALISSRGEVRDCLADNVHFATNLVSDSISSVCLDLEALSQLEKMMDISLLKDAEKVLDEMYLGDDFPLYAVSIDRKTGEINDASLNTAEALTVLLHLSQADQAGLRRADGSRWLKPESLNFVCHEVARGTLVAGYETDGKPYEERAFYSSACYALAARILLREGEARLASLALDRMDRVRIWDVTDSMYGGYGHAGEPFRSYDQLQALLAYLELRTMGRK